MSEPAAVQTLLFEAEVIPQGGGAALVRARKPVIEGAVSDAQRILGGKRAVSREAIIALLQAGVLDGWKLNEGKTRSDGKAPNTKWIVNLASAYELRERRRELASVR